MASGRPLEHHRHLQLRKTSCVLPWRPTSVQISNPMGAVRDKAWVYRDWKEIYRKRVCVLVDVAIVV